MPAIASTSSSLADERLVLIPLERLIPHPANPNVMSEGQLAKLARNLAREGRYPPLVVRPHPFQAGAYELLDGEQRWKVLPGLGHSEALCFIWPCDDETALLLLATLNRLRGEDVPARRAELLAGLTNLITPEELALLLPEDAGQITALLGLLELDSEALLADLQAASEKSLADGPRLLSFAVGREDEAVVEEAIARAAEGLAGNNRRGRALALVCGIYLEVARG